VYVRTCRTSIETIILSMTGSPYIVDVLIGEISDVTVPLFNVEGSVICTGEDIEYEDVTSAVNADYYTLDLPTRTYTISYHSNL
jgi:hypothetical protein